MREPFAGRSAAKRRGWAHARGEKWWCPEESLHPCLHDCHHLVHIADDHQGLVLRVLHLQSTGALRNLWRCSSGKTVTWSSPRTSSPQTQSTHRCIPVLCWPALPLSSPGFGTPREPNSSKPHFGISKLCFSDPKQWGLVPVLFQLFPGSAEVTPEQLQRPFWASFQPMTLASTCLRALVCNWYSLGNLSWASVGNRSQPLKKVYWHPFIPFQVSLRSFECPWKSELASFKLVWASFEPITLASTCLRALVRNWHSLGYLSCATVGNRCHRWRDSIGIIVPFEVVWMSLKKVSWRRLSLFERHLSVVWAHYLGFYLLARPCVQLV